MLPARRVGLIRARSVAGIRPPALPRHGDGSAASAEQELPWKTKAPRESLFSPASAPEERHPSRLGAAPWMWGAQAVPAGKGGDSSRGWDRQGSSARRHRRLQTSAGNKGALRAAGSSSRLLQSESLPPRAPRLPDRRGLRFARGVCSSGRLRELGHLRARRVYSLNSVLLVNPKAIAFCIWLLSFLGNGKQKRDLLRSRGDRDNPPVISAPGHI